MSYSRQMVQRRYHHERHSWRSRLHHRRRPRRDWSTSGKAPGERRLLGRRGNAQAAAWVGTDEA